MLEHWNVQDKRFFRASAGNIYCINELDGKKVNQEVKCFWFCSLTLTWDLVAVFVTSPCDRFWPLGGITTKKCIQLHISNKPSFFYEFLGHSEFNVSSTVGFQAWILNYPPFCYCAYKFHLIVSLIQLIEADIQVMLKRYGEKMRCLDPDDIFVYMLIIYVSKFWHFFNICLNVISFSIKFSSVLCIKNHKECKAL